MLNVINLGEYLKGKSKVFTGNDFGDRVRIMSKIDSLSLYSEITIIVPNNVRSINPSFLESFLKNVVINLGKELFKSRINFYNNGIYKVDDDINNAIERILRIKD